MKNVWHKFPALACISVGLILVASCKQKPRPLKDFSQAESISVNLKNSNREDGLRQIESEKATKTLPAKVGGFECRSLKIPDNQEGFIYFIIDPTFKATNVHEVKVVVEYFDATQGSFTIEYDGESGKYSKANRLIHQKRTLQWEIAEFILKNTRFQNLQDNNADFRLRITVPEFFIRRVEVLRDTTSTLSDEKRPESVSILLQDKPVEDGLRLINERDGKSTPAVIEGQSCRRLERLYMYFAIDSSFKWAPRMRAKVEVELFDASPGLLEIHYDAWSDQGTTQGAYTRAPRSVRLRQSKQWRTETFILPEARFEQRENGHSDFRLCASQPEVYIRRVTVSRDDTPEKPNLPPVYTGSNSVSITFSKTNISDGLQRVFVNDSQTSPAVINGQECLTVVPVGRGPESYIYFAVDPSFKRREPANFVLEVEYFSFVRPVFTVQYNSLGDPTAPLNIYRPSAEIRGNTNTWTNARFLLTNALFQSLQNGNADFRLLTYTPPFHVRKVTLR